MTIIQKLTLRHLRLNRSRTIITFISILLSITMVYAVAGLAASLHDVLRRTIIASEGEYHVCYMNISPDIAELLKQDERFTSAYIKPEDSVSVSVYAMLDRPTQYISGNIYMVLNNIYLKYSSDPIPRGVRVNTELLSLDGALFISGGTFMAVMVLAAIFILIILSGSVAVIANAFYISASDRVRQFGLLKSVGATKKQIRRSVLFESLCLALVSIPAGFLLGYGIQAVSMVFLNDLLLTSLTSRISNTDTAFHVVFDWRVFLITAVIAMFTVLISAWLPARRAAKTNPIDAIRKTRDVKMTAKSLKTSRLTHVLFGFEGTLASKSLRRNKGSYRATVISLVISIVLFVSMSSLIGYINRTTQQRYSHDYDVAVFMTGTPQELDEGYALLSTIPDASLRRIWQASLLAKIPESLYSEIMLQGKSPNNDNEAVFISIGMLPDIVFETISPILPGSVPGILKNTNITRYSDGSTYKKYNYKPGHVLPVWFSSGMWDSSWEFIPDFNITLAAEIQDLSVLKSEDWIVYEFADILIPESCFRSLYGAMPERDEISGTAYESPETVIRVTTADADGFSIETAKLLPAGSYSIINYSLEARKERNIITAIRLFGYGFITLLSLIGVTSVITTISTGMALRRQEFAMLYSVGMTGKGMNRMLNLESLLYGLKALLIGLPLGIGLTAVFHISFIQLGLSDAYTPPIAAVAVCTATVMLITFSVMRYGKHKMKKLSIVEALRSEAV